MTTRRDFFKKGFLGGAGMVILGNSFASENFMNKVEGTLPILSEGVFELPKLPYAYDALEPFIDKQTMEIHYTKHHQGYVSKLNKALATEKINETSLDVICNNASKYSSAVRNNAGGHYNHSMFWKGMKPNVGSVLSPSTANEPTGKIADTLKNSFDSFANFKTLFSEKAGSVFGSGWAWLVINKAGKLEIGSTSNQDNPLMDLSEFKGKPILGLDVWEHAYYLKYQNKRTDYINSWWNIVNWEEANIRLEAK